MAAMMQISHCVVVRRSVGTWSVVCLESGCEYARVEFPRISQMIRLPARDATDAISGRFPNQPECSLSMPSNQRDSG